MHRKKMVSVFGCGMMVLALALGGCSQSGQKNTVQFVDTSVTGTVEEIDENTIMLSVGGNTGGGQMPGIAGEEGAANTETPPEKPENGGESGAGAGTETPAESGAGAGTETPPEKPEAGGESGAGEESAAGADTEPTEESNPETAAGEAQEGESMQPENNPQSSGITAELVIKDESVIKNGEEKASLADIEEGDILTVTIDSEGEITEITIGEAQQGMTGGVESYTALQEFTEDETVSDETYMSDGIDENAILVSDGAEVTLKNIKAYRDSDESTGGDNASFYGVGADLLVTDGTAYVAGGEYTTDAKGGAGIFAYDKGIVYAADASIKTSQDTSGGIHAAGDGTLYAWDMDISTAGESSAAIRSDRGGGTMVVDGGTYSTKGTGSPAVYCTADIAVNDAVLTADNSEGICIEGKNSLRLYDCTLTGNMPDNEQNDCTWNVIVYQSMSGDSEVGNGTFHMIGGSLTAENGGMFYTTNTECTMLLSNVDITYADENEFFLRCTGNNNARGWGQSGSNGSQCSFTADEQEMKGDIIWDSISTLDFYMTNGSTLEGAFVKDETYAGGGGEGYCNAYISEDSVWTVTGDSVLGALYNAGTIQDSEGRSVTIVGEDGTIYVEGDSEYKITVGSYDTDADMSGASVAETFADYEVEKPEALK